jgi:ABC-2 type transport system permease protein
VPLAFTLSVLIAFIVVFYVLVYALIQRGRGLRT